MVIHKSSADIFVELSTSLNALTYAKDDDLTWLTVKEVHNDEVKACVLKFIDEMFFYGHPFVIASDIVRNGPNASSHFFISKHIHGVGVGGMVNGGNAILTVNLTSPLLERFGDGDGFEIHEFNGKLP